MSMHCVVSGWLLGPHSGANSRLLCLLEQFGSLLLPEERITVLHGPVYQPPACDRINWRPIDIPAASTMRRAIAERRRLPRMLRDLGATVYDHGFLPPPRLRTPTCLTLHDLRGADGYDAWPALLARSVLRNACRRASAIVTVSEWTKTRLLAHVRKAPPITVVPNAVAAPDAHASLELPESELPRNGYVLHVGHLEARKNLAVLVRALACMDPEHAPELWLAGNDAGAGASLDQLANDLGVASLVRRLGAVPDERLGALYRHARLFVMPSLYEGFGLPALEALAHGRPVLAANAAALPEVLAGNATLLPPDDPDAWARALAGREADGQQERQQRTASATRHTWRQSAASLLQVWRDLSL